MKELCYVMIKPEFANNSEVIKEVQKMLITKSGCALLRANIIKYSVEDAQRHYAEHVGKGFYPELENYITSDIALGMIFEGEEAISKIRALVGATKNPQEGTIRYEIPKMMGLELRITQNVVHASDSMDSAKREIEIFEDIIKRQDA